jgi:hypothetical protein
MTEKTKHHIRGEKKEKKRKEKENPKKTPCVHSWRSLAETFRSLPHRARRHHHFVGVFREYLNYRQTYNLAAWYSTGCSLFIMLELIRRVNVFKTFGHNIWVTFNFMVSLAVKKKS